MDGGGGGEGEVGVVKGGGEVMGGGGVGVVEGGGEVMGGGEWGGERSGLWRGAVK